MGAEIFHENGIHVLCDVSWCVRAGLVEEWHGHDFDGPLVCGCDDWSE